MTEKDLMKGLNYIDDDLIEEAAQERKPKNIRRLGWRFPVAAAAVLVLGIGWYANFGGGFSPKNNADIRVATETQEDQKKEEQITETVAGAQEKEAREKAGNITANDAGGTQSVLQIQEENAVTAAAAAAGKAEEAVKEDGEEAVKALGEAVDEEAGEQAEAEVGEAADEAADEPAAEEDGEAVDEPAAEADGEDAVEADMEEAGAASLEEAGEADGMFRAAKDYAEVYRQLEAAEQKSSVFTVTEDTDSGIVLYEAEEAAKGGTAAVADLGAPVAGTAARADHSDTNTMTEGVDESDIVKTDGSYIYVAAGGQVRIIDIREGVPGWERFLSMPEEAAMDSVEELYVDENRLVVIGTHVSTNPDVPTWEDVQEGAAKAYFPPEHAETVAAVFDLSGGEEPVFRGALKQDGGYDTSRRVGEELIVFSQLTVHLPDRKEEDAVSEGHLSDWIPAVNGKPLAANRIYLSEDSCSGTLMSSVNLSAPEQTKDAVFLFTQYAETYVSGSAVFLYYSKWPDFMDGSAITRLLKISWQEGRFSFSGAASVKGTVTDRFAIQEQNGVLRVLTTDYSGQEDINTLFLLDSDLKETGRLENIAPGERIYAARFLGDLAYFVTYRNTDPLFAADLSDVTAPKLLGELSITGFSEYLHPWDPTHLLGIGYETDPDTGNILGVKLTMFDISDPADIRVEYSKVLEGDGGGSAVDWNYKGILADPGKNLIGFFAWKNVYESARPCYYVFSYDPAEGFSTRLRSVQEEYDDLSEECRGLYAGETFYIVDSTHILAYRMTDNGELWKKADDGS